MGIIKYASPTGEGSVTPYADAEDYLSRNVNRLDYGNKKQYGEEIKQANPIETMKDMYISPGKQEIPDYTSFIDKYKRVA